MVNTIIIKKKVFLNMVNTIIIKKSILNMGNTIIIIIIIKKIF